MRSTAAWRIDSFAGRLDVRDNGTATDTLLCSPFSVAVDAAGNNRIRKVDSSGVITTIVRTGERSIGGDGGPATDAQLLLCGVDTVWHPCVPNEEKEIV